VNHLITRPPGIPLFTLNPPHAAGRRARKGFEFQDQYAAYILARFFSSGQEEFVAARLEAVEDIDVLAIVEGLPVERYYQVKSKDEGTGSWTLRHLEDSGILGRFFFLYKQFEQKKREQNRRLELVLSVEGDLSSELSDLKLRAWEAAESRNNLYASLRLGELLLTAGGSYYQNAKAGIRKLYESEAGNFPEVEQPGWRLSEKRSPALREVAVQSGRTLAEVTEDLNRTAQAVVPYFRGFVASLRFESRLGSLEQLTYAYILQGGDLSPDEAHTAAGRLLRAIRDESLSSEPTEISPATLSRWLGSPERELLQSKPDLATEAVHRAGLLDEVRKILEGQPALVLHGLPEVGKSQLVSALIDECGKVQDYFWFAFSGERGDTARLLRQLAAWCGKRTGVWLLKDDVYAGLLQPAQVIARLARIALPGAWMVLDDCHKLEDGTIFKLLRTVTDAWPESKLIFVSEEKLPEPSEFGVPHLLVHGFEPKESLEFVTKLGLDVSLAPIEFAMLCVRVDGHPLMLRAAVSELPVRPSAAQVSEVTKRLPSVEPVKGFLDALSNEIFFKLIRTSEQRAWLGRLAVLTLPFTRSIAFRVAALDPAIQVAEADWRYLRSFVLDQSAADHYSVPQLIRELATSEARVPDAPTILIAAARHVFGTALATRQIDFLDFQGAIFSLILAQACEEAAMRFIFSLPSFATVESFEPFEFLFLVLNGPPIHAKLPDPGTRWFLLNAEVGLRIADRDGAKDPKLFPLLRRMRLLFHEEWTPAQKKLYFRAMHHVTACYARMRRAGANLRPEAARRRRKFVAPIGAALRLALLSGNQELILDVLRIYDQLHVLASRPDVELIKRAVLHVATQAPPTSAESLVTLYAQYVIGAEHSDTSLRLVREHSEEYLDKGLNDAYFACMHAKATALLERFNEPSQARELIGGLLARASELKLSPHCVARGELLIADARWAEKNYFESKNNYDRALAVEYDDPALTQYATQRLCDSMMGLAQYKEGVQVALQALRSRHSKLPVESKAQLYARLAYGYALSGESRKAAVSCLALCGTAKYENSDALYCLAATVAAWVLSHVAHSDPTIPKIDVQIADSSALSQEIPPEQVKAFLEGDAFKTKATLVVATIFELLGEARDLRRGGFLLRRALAVVEGAGETHPKYLDASYVIRIRITRLEIKERRFTEAAASFRAAVSSIVERVRRENSMAATEGPSVGAVLHLVEPSIKGYSDAEVSCLFDSFCGQFRGNPVVCAWLRFHESNILFERYAVQAAKRKLLEAELLAHDRCDKLLIIEIIYDKLFNRVQQFYSTNRNAWLVDALNAAVVLAGDDIYGENRSSFANNVMALSRHQAGPPFDDLNITVERFKEASKDQVFLVVTYAMWGAATRHRLLAGCLNTIETYLRQNATFLTDADFV
jgi:hypothetical protein